MTVSHPINTTFVAIALTALALTSVAQARPVGKIRHVRPLVETRAGAGGQWATAKERFGMEPGQSIRSGPTGRADLVFTNGTQVVLNSKAQVVIEGDDTPVKPLALRVMGALAQVVVRSKGPMQIRAAAAIAAPQGTEYMVSLPDENTMVVTVSEGTVHFYNAQGEQTVNANQQSTAKVGEAPTRPIAVDASGLMQWAFDVAGLPVEFELPGAAKSDLAASQAAVDANANDAAAWMALGEAKRQGDDANGAVAAFQRSLQINPSEGARLGLALALLARKDTGAARDALAAAPDSALVQAARGLVQLRANEVGAAEQSLREAARLDPQLSQAPTLLALVHLTQNKSADAVADARRAVQLAPSSAQAASSLALALFYSGNVREASRAAARAVQLSPESPLALLAQGQALLARHQTDAARTAFQQAEALAPRLPLIQTNLGSAYARLDMPQRAAKAYRRALEQAPDSASAHTGLGSVLLATNQPQDALVELRRALELEPQNSLAQANLGAYYIKMGDFAAAKKVLVALGEDPAAGANYIYLSESSLFEQKLFEPQEYARKAVKLLPDSAPAHYQLGRVYREMERSVQAEQEFRQAVILDPQFAEARFALGLAREAAESGSDFNRPLGAIASNSSGPRQALNIQNLQTPGTEDRIQAAIQDPSVVRTASRAFGGNQIEGRIGEDNTNNLSLSHLQDINGGRGSFGAGASRDHTNGIRDNADLTEEKAGFTYGSKKRDDPSGFFALGEFDRRGFGANTAVDPTTTLGADSRRVRINLPTGIIGYNFEKAEAQRTRLLLQADQPKSRLTDVFGFQDTNGRSFHAEVRHDWKVNARTNLVFGGAWGKRNFDFNALSLAPPPPPGQPPYPDIVNDGYNRINQSLVFMRGESQLSDKLSFSAELKAIRLKRDSFTEITSPPGFPAGSVERTGTTVGLPKLVLLWKPARTEIFQFRVRSLMGSVQDFELLAPEDTFLFPFDDAPGLVFFKRGRSLEAEYTHVFPNASFLRIGAYDQRLDQANDHSEAVSAVRFRTLKTRYEGALGSCVTFFTGLNLTDSSSQLDLAPFGPLLTGYDISLQPKVSSEVGIQYLSPTGWFVQPSAVFIGRRLLSADSTGARSQVGSFDLLNLRVGKRNGLRSTIFIEIANLFDKTYIQPGLNVNGDLQPGRQIRLGGSYRF